MNYLDIIDKINIPNMIKEKIEELIDNNKNEYLMFSNELTIFENGDKTLLKLYEKYKDDLDNLNILAIYILSLENVYKKYKEVCIDDEIFFETMKCFTRFIYEAKEKSGRYYFDRAFWTYRQTSMSLFRLGQLEYEFITENSTQVISVHIPSDAILTKENIDESLCKMKEFVKKYFPSYVGSKVICSSWLLSPKLKQLLDEKSRILLFQNYFDIISYNCDSLDIFEWVFKTNNQGDIKNLRENTSLQRKIKKMLENGENVGSAKGILKKNGF